MKVQKMADGCTELRWMQILEGFVSVERERGFSYKLWCTVFTLCTLFPAEGFARKDVRLLFTVKDRQLMYKLSKLIRYGWLVRERFGWYKLTEKSYNLYNQVLDHAERSNVRYQGGVVIPPNPVKKTGSMLSNL